VTHAPPPIDPDSRQSTTKTNRQSHSQSATPTVMRPHHQCRAVIPVAVKLYELSLVVSWTLGSLSLVSLQSNSASCRRRQLRLVVTIMAVSLVYLLLTLSFILGPWVRVLYIHNGANFKHIIMLYCLDLGRIVSGHVYLI
jgi:hypothetical protein